MKNPFNKAIGHMPPNFTAGFDSGLGFVTALSHFLKGEDFEGLGTMPAIKPLASIINLLPRKLRETLYVESTGAEGINPNETGSIEAEEFSKAVVNMYPKRKYPAIIIGSSSGAVSHLAAAMGIPFLPQTHLIPINRPSSLSVDDPKATMEWGIPSGEALLKNNPQLKLHFMMDPAQDRLTLEKVGFFRVKMQRVDLAYERFIIENLQEGGTIIISNCERKWPVTTINKRFSFQFGCVGGADQEDYFQKTDRTAAFLEKYNANVRSWDPPKTDSHQPESEWGFDPAISDDILRIAKDNDYGVREWKFEDADDPSPFVAELYKWFYHKNGVLTNRLVVESFIMHDPYWMLKTGSIPFWMKFNMETSAARLKEYLEKSDQYDEIYLMLFSHGTEGIGFTGIEDWKKIIGKSRYKNDFLGVDTEKFPWDLGSMIMYNKDFQEKITDRYTFGTPLTFEKLDGFYLEFQKNSPFKDRIVMQTLKEGGQLNNTSKPTISNPSE
ncbi:hypothetical protein [Anditalea andensis]|uniref:Uncharacterized protein n=1 Tax=Anditalea andensis TaxID=1048983 RepID=A0A074LPA7_9BACT|nr:hypothetical protein [Anditalea andensis]KEO75747.1 hypothetical protein EL17_22235 [Anditalea andensis]